MAVTEANDRDRLAESFCQALALVTGSDSVVLVQLDGDSVHELARHERVERSSLLSAERFVTGLPQSSSTSVTWHHLTDVEKSNGTAMTLIDLPAGDARTLALVHGEVDDNDRESVLLLVDIAEATADRLDSAEQLREQELRLRALSDQIKGLRIAGSDDDRHDRAAQFASTAALLTERERDILEDLLRGASNASIAESHTLSIETVKTHVKHILRKMGASNRAELIARSG